MTGRWSTSSSLGVLGRMIWGTDTAAFYRDIARLTDLPAGTSVLDIPCGGGVAFRGLRPDQELDYVAADLSPVMLRRARAEADRRGIHWIEFVEADVEALPFEDRSFDLVVDLHGPPLLPGPTGRDRRDGARAAPGRRAARHIGDQADGAAPGRVRAPHAARWGVRPGQTLAELETSLADAGLVKVSTSRETERSPTSRLADVVAAEPAPRHHLEVEIDSAVTHSSQHTTR